MTNVDAFGSLTMGASRCRMLKDYYRRLWADRPFLSMAAIVGADGQPASERSGLALRIGVALQVGQCFKMDNVSNGARALSR